MISPLFAVLKSSQLNSRLINADDVELEELETKKYVAFLRHNGSYICGGCLISETRILTAAQCFYIFISLTIRAINDLSVLLSKTEYKALSILIHDRYNYGNPRLTLSYDIGIVVVSLIIIQFDY